MSAFLKYKDSVDKYLNNKVLKEGYSFALINERYVDIAVKWRNKYNDLFREGEELSREKQLKFIESYEEKDRIDFILLYLNQPIGIFHIKSLSDAFPRIGKLIGEDGFKEKGIAKMATIALLDFGFNKLGFETLYAMTKDYNIRNIKLNEKIGFKIEKTLDIEGEKYYLMKIDKEVFNVRNLRSD